MTGSPALRDDMVALPDGSQPDGSRPDGSRPDGSRPDALRPDGSRPDALRPDALRPDALRPDALRPDALRLALRRADGPGRPFLLVHGLASNARMWDGVAARLAAAGHEVVAVDQRGHGRSDAPLGGYTTEQCAADLAALCAVLGLTGERAPVVAGQSWGGNVVLTLAARHGGVAALALVDGGWIRLGDRFATFEECWAQLEPPRFDGVSMADLRARAGAWHPDWPPEGRAGMLANFRVRPDGTAAARLDRAHHREIVASLWQGDPRPLYPQVTVPVLLVPAVSAVGRAAGVAEALELLPAGRVVDYVGADHDLHAQHPDRLAADLLALADEAGGAAGVRGGATGARP